jgi:hypothetical protein
MKPLPISVTLKWTPLLLGLFLRLLFLFIAPPEALYSTGRIHDAPFPGHERVALAAQFDLDDLPRGSRGDSIATRAYDLRVRKILGMNLLFHDTNQRRR